MKKYYFFALTAFVIFAAAPPIFKLTLSNIPPFVLAAIRFLGAGLLFTPFLFKKHARLTLKDFLLISFSALLGITINVGAFFLGLEYAPSINVQIVGALGPLLLYFMSLYFLKEKPHPQIIEGILISIVGVLIVILGPLVNSQASLFKGYTFSSILIGNVLFFLAVVGANGMTILNKKLLKSYPTEFLTGVEFMIGGFFFLPLALGELNTWDFSQVTTTGLLGILFGVFLCSGLAYFFLNRALTKIPAQEVGVLGYIGPFVSILVAMPLLGEYPDYTFLIGMVFVFLGIYVSERHPQFRQKPKKLHR